ncbi:hypothetical protein BC777_2089 [Yoonia maricola]|uniref:Porin n=1 Tax=Yoonia maricola TaxID=420999 RepID=A0A2M8W496_9RHOB|nr:hypothetical protein [Yoonia maricola]PJI85743.1 hypothetical protein BC777_2089 [Yoonia maricola]
MQYKAVLQVFAVTSTFIVPQIGTADTLTFGTDLELEVDNDNSTITATPYLEYATNFGVYVGADVSNEDSDTDDYSVSAYIGYGGEVGLFTYDLYYGHYYLNETGDDGEEVIATLGYPVFGGLTMETALISDLDDTESLEQSFYYALPAAYEISGAYEFVDGEHTDDWDLGVSKTLTEEIALDLRYYDSEDDSPSVAMTVSYATDVAGLFGG